MSYLRYSIRPTFPTDSLKEETPPNLADLLSKMSIHSNTSGIQKAYHKQWGGRSQTALDRIKTDIQLQRLQLVDEVRGQVFNTYAEKLFSENPTLKVDIIYADPPYNQHQYGSNYHLLTTAFKNRDYPVPDKKAKGTISGIRSDASKSKFCSKPKIEGVFSEFVKSVENHTKYLLVAYNHEGFLSCDKMVDILSQGGKHTVSYQSNDHKKYAGGKASEGLSEVVEFIFIVQMNTPQSTEEIDSLKQRLNLESTVLYWSGKIKKEGYRIFEPAATLAEARRILQHYKDTIHLEYQIYTPLNEIEPKDVHLVANQLRELESDTVSYKEILKVAKEIGVWVKT